MFNSVGLLECNRSSRIRERNLQRQHHHHGHRHLQQFGQLNHLHRGRRLAAPRHLVFPGPCHHGSLSPAALLLKPRTSTWPPFFSASSFSFSFSSSSSFNYPTQSSLAPLHLHCTETTRLTWMASATFFFCPP